MCLFLNILDYVSTLYYWRDLNGRVEIDPLVDLGIRLVPIEIKSGETIIPEFFKSIKNCSEVAATNPEDGYIIYAGTTGQKRSGGTIISWHDASSLIPNLESKK